MIRAWMLALAMAVTALGGQLLQPRSADQVAVPQPELERLVPESFEQWRIDDLSMMVRPDTEVTQQLGKLYAATLERTYVDSSGYRIMLSIAYGTSQTDNLRAHLPELCYAAQGFQVEGLIQERVYLGAGYAAMPVTRMLARSSLRVEPVTYWLNLSGRVVNNQMQRKLASLAFGMQGEVPDGMLVRVSSVDPDMTRAYQHQDRFLRQLLEEMGEDQRKRVFGGSSLSAIAGG